MLDRAVALGQTAIDAVADPRPEQSAPSVTKFR